MHIAVLLIDCPPSNIPAVIDLLFRQGGSWSDAGEVGIPRGTSVRDSPLVCLGVETVGVGHHHPRNLGILGVFRFGALEQRLERKEGRLDGQDGGPRSAKRVEADGSLVTAKHGQVSYRAACKGEGWWYVCRRGAGNE